MWAESVLNRLSFAPTLGCSALGRRKLRTEPSPTVLVACGLALAGYLLEDQYERVEHWINPVSTAVVVGIIALYVWRVIRWKPDA